MNELLLNPVVLRVGVMVFHALWELALVGFLAWGTLALLRRRSAQAQYLIACAFLGAMLAAPIVTIFLVMPSAEAPTTVVVAAGGMTVPVEGLEAMTLRWTLVRLMPLAPWLALLWFTGAALMLARLGTGLWWLERRYLAEAQPAPDVWQSALDDLARRLGLAPRVRLKVSAWADSPLLIGWLRPVVLLPASALLHLRPEALEAVLAHELAHVRRRDYLANLLQSLAEAFLFFHPCAWWLSGRIRELREHCCDDTAAALCGDPLVLAEGLSALECLRRRIQPDPEPALAAAKGKLMSRITRLFRPQDLPVSQGHGLLWTLLGASLLGAATLTAQHAAGPEAKGPGATVQILAAARGESKADGVQEFDFAKIKVAHQPPAPAYPAEAKLQKIQGTVVVELTVDEAGAPVEVKALEGPEALAPTAVEYAKSWRFEPARVDGKAVKARFRLSMPFRLREDAPVGKTSKGKADTTPGLAQDTAFSRIKVAYQPPAPAYPADAKLAKIQGTVEVEIIVNEQGVPVGVKALSGPEELRPTALGYAEDWRFAPFKVKGKAVKARFKLSMPFRLR